MLPGSATPRGLSKGLRRHRRELEPPCPSFLPTSQRHIPHSRSGTLALGLLTSWQNLPQGKPADLSAVEDRRDLVVRPEDLRAGIDGGLALVGRLGVHLQLPAIEIDGP